MRKVYLSLIALVAGFGLALLAAGVHSLFFVLLPVLAFVFGYFVTWRWGLLNGFLLFAGYTFAISVLWWGFDSPNLLYPLPYIAAFVFGGFGLLPVGAMAPLVKNGVRKAGSVSAFIVLAAMIGWCGYNAVPHYSYYYQVALQSSEDLTNVELYLPAATVSGEPYDELYGHVYNIPGDEFTDRYLTHGFSQELVETEYGTMLKITIPALKKDDVPVPRYTANIIWRANAPYRVLYLMPKMDVETVNTVTWSGAFGPVKVHESLVVERFNVPMKIVSDTPGPVRVTLWNRTDRSEAVNFAYSKSYPYTERIDYGGSEYEGYTFTTTDDWIFVPVEATVVMQIRGISD